MEDWALIRRLHQSDGLSQRAIAKQLGIARATVAGALAADRPPKYERPAVTKSAWLQVEPVVRHLLAETPSMPASADRLDGFDLVAAGEHRPPPPGVRPGRSG